MSIFEVIYIGVMLLLFGGWVYLRLRNEKEIPFSEIKSDYDIETPVKLPNKVFSFSSKCDGIFSSITYVVVDFRSAYDIFKKFNVPNIVCLNLETKTWEYCINVAEAEEFYKTK